MSMHRSVFRKKGSARLAVFTCAGGWLIALQLWLALSSTAFAAPLAPEVLTRDTPYNLARAGVSVVRLLVTYRQTANTGVQSGAATNQVICTGLGVIVASWPATQANQINTWLLTDGYLVAQKGSATCTGDHPELNFQQIQVVTSDFYNSSQAITFTASSSAVQVKCLGTTACPTTGSALNTPVLVGFSNKLQTSGDDMGQTLSPAEPYIDIAPTPRAVNAQASPLVLSLPDASGAPLSSVEDSDSVKFNTYLQVTPQYRAPVVTDTKNLEPGAPMINQNGELTAIQLKGTNSVFASPSVEASAIDAAIPDFAKNIQGNVVHMTWDNGLNAFYAQNGAEKDLTLAKTSFTAAAKANPNFKAASDFAQFSTENNQSDNTPPANPRPSTFLSMELWQVALLGFALLLILLAVVTVLFRRSRSHTPAGSGFTPEELAEADRRATIEAQRIKEIEMKQTLVPPPPAAKPGPVLASTQGRDLLCPNCNSVVPHDAKFCPNCRMWLSPSESGLHLRLQPQQPAPAPSISEMPTMPPSPPPAVVTVSPASLAEMPTVPVGGLKASTLAEQPTVEVKAKDAVNLDTEKTQPYTKKSTGPRLGFIVGTRSDPGIKRQYKPNEDSLFAAQGFIQAPNALPFGLFVVADGMGGHANGQDASRLAIQTIVDYILPRLLKGGLASPDVYTHLMVEGIQSANQAVHQRNMDQRGDMGTTVTGALLVENTAYVANVGDSRTYLYRESNGGLTKVTNDHSVVASLVEAGIIKPDDIYTHPKRSHIYRSLGEKASVEVDEFTVPLQEGDKILVCSDGLWDMVRDPQIEEVIRAPHEPKMISEKLIEAAYAGGGEDNVSVIVVQISRISKALKGARLQVLAMPDNLQVPPL